MDLTNLTLKEASEGLKAKKFSSVDLTKAYFERIKKVDKNLHAYVLETEEQALKDAEKADEILAKGEGSALTGIPCALKDNFNTKGVRTTCCSKILENFVPPYDATVVKKLKEAGVVVLGKTNTDEFTCGGSTEHSCFGPTSNPWDVFRVAGGSSGGSACAVASNMAVFALGTDTGGSIREPASFCGCVGLKVTYGRVSRSGVTSFASSWDTIGPLAKTVEDAAMVLQAIAGHDDLDSTTPNIPVPDYLKNIDKGVKGLKIGIPKEYFEEGIEVGVREVVMNAVKEYEKMGAEIVEISLPMTKYAVAAYYIAAPAELSANLARFDGIRYGRKPQNEGEDLLDYYFAARGEGFGDEIKRRVMIGTYVLSAGYYDAYYKKAQKVRTLIIKDFEDAFKKVDVMITPVAPIPAWKIGEKMNDPLAMYLADAFTIPINAAGVPAMSVPAGFVKGDKGDLPVGIQIIGPQFSEELLFQVGNAYEKNSKVKAQNVKPQFKA
ncbi:MAG: aspartyl/glutamyl-tRNA amidotransferase subunit A, aspartyl-tRNA(Asn)/glutamyl-tRNA (Gln) amidotransferase subunit A [Candidatus Peregrinibacteria bacterium GW2011_GWF2_38_29]|nr:MAG: aspartyl/glutamyl-tRNA amidotransferase subunit A, aspartyl-tRNA(Asn)/glutamyl-tRNA (Gln) amidotransferase subunit A [Candidatus Peregrinibacteria bacterium GW2011_GWF2_38_29]HBB02235.1 Asp-tRNA(Asn)/Glu-tRNA(Gln) amidotransferase GatCAB subunit A [Candidatus Peregrinibacteria bacterium]